MIKIGVQLEPQYTSFAAYRWAWLALDGLGVDSLWTWDHFFPLHGPGLLRSRVAGRLRRHAAPLLDRIGLRRIGAARDYDGPAFEGWTTLAALGPLTQWAQVGCLVLAIGYRNPALLSAMARTLDHATGGRLILALGAGWFERDYREYGFPFGPASGRLRELERGLEVIRARWAYDSPPPVRGTIPILIGGDGERVTLRIAARHADLWNGFGPPDRWARKNRVLDDWCRALGRDPRAIERTAALGRWELDQLDAYAEAGAEHLIYPLGTPFDPRPVERLLDWRERRR